jgi:hypothetical protein
MSYEIVRKIRIDNTGVYITSCSNNVYPKHYGEWRCSTLSAMLDVSGRREVDLEILRQYENNNFQGTPNQYSKAIKRLESMPEYIDFNWHTTGKPYDYDKTHEYREAHSAELSALMLRAFTNKLTITEACA